jgi:hypothetical protein
MPCDLCPPSENIIIRIQTGFNQGVTCHSRHDAVAEIQRILLQNDLATAEIIISVIKPEKFSSFLKQTA